MSMRESKFAALMGMSQNRATTYCKAVKRSKTAGNSQFWRTYSARVYDGQLVLYLQNGGPSGPQNRK